MKNLSELQGELYKLSAALDALSRQVEDLKPKEDTGAPDYAVLEELARQLPIENPVLSQAGDEEQERYLRLLSTAAALEEQGTMDKLLYLCRVSIGSNCPRPALELQKMAYETDRLDWQSAAGSLKKLALPLLLDMLMVSNLSGPAEDRTLEFISSTAELLKCEEDDVTVTAQLATTLLTQDEEAFGQIDAKHAYPELGYLVPEKWLENFRGPELQYRKVERVDAGVVLKSIGNLETHCDILENVFESFLGVILTQPAIVLANELVTSGTRVAQGMPLVKFTRKFSDNSENLYEFAEPDPVPITANRSGIVFFQDHLDSFRRIYIINPFDRKLLLAVAATHSNPQ